jgi:hypothetical protein
VTRALETGSCFENSQSVGGFDAANLPGIPRKYNPRVVILSEMEEVMHLPARNHARFIDDQNLSWQRALGRSAA